MINLIRWPTKYPDFNSSSVSIVVVRQISIAVVMTTKTRFLLPPAHLFDYSLRGPEALSHFSAETFRGFSIMRYKVMSEENFMVW